MNDLMNNNVVHFLYTFYWLYNTIVLYLLALYIIVVQNSSVRTWCTEFPNKAHKISKYLDKLLVVNQYLASKLTYPIVHIFFVNPIFAMNSLHFNLLWRSSEKKLQHIMCLAYWNGRSPSCVVTAITVIYDLDLLDRL